MAPVVVLVGKAPCIEAVEIGPAAVRSGLEAENAVARVPRAVQDGGLQIGELRIERLGVRIDRRDRGIVGEELEDRLRELGRVGAAADPRLDLVGDRLGDRIAVQRCGLERVALLMPRRKTRVLPTFDPRLAVASGVRG